LVAYISRSVVRLLAVWVELQAVQKAMVSKEAAIFVIICFELRGLCNRDSPDGLYNYYISPRIGKKDFCEARRNFAKGPFA
jgi:hypothetical protein